jgi:diamine N-acetyltransferase
MDTKNTTIRYASTHEAQFLTDLGARAFTEAFAIYNTPEDLASYLAEAFSPEKQAEELRRPGSSFLILEVNGTTAGYAHLQEGHTPECITGKRPVELVRFYLLTEWIGKGFGSHLMQACIAEARGRGADVLWLGVWEKNTRAIVFYKKWYFEVVGTHGFQLGSDLQQDFLMERSLEQE